MKRKNYHLMKPSKRAALKRKLNQTKPSDLQTTTKFVKALRLSDPSTNLFTFLRFHYDYTIHLTDVLTITAEDNETQRTYRLVYEDVFPWIRSSTLPLKGAFYMFKDASDKDRKVSQFVVAVKWPFRPDKDTLKIFIRVSIPLEGTETLTVVLKEVPTTVEERLEKQILKLQKAQDAQVPMQIKTHKPVVLLCKEKKKTRILENHNEGDSYRSMCSRGVCWYFLYFRLALLGNKEWRTI
jgi:hypothetical protein